MKPFHYNQLNRIALVLCCLLQSALAISQEMEEPAIAGESWSMVKQQGEGKLVLLYYKRRPFNYLDEYARQTGIDYELVNLFTSFVKRKYNVTIEPLWIEVANYEELSASFPSVRNGAIGFPAKSLSEDIRHMAIPSPPYMHNKLVVVTHPKVPQASSKEELQKTLQQLVAFYVDNTAAYQELKKLNLFAKTKQVASEESLADSVAQHPNSYALMPLYDYFIALKRGLEVARQPFIEIPQADIFWWFPKNTDWNEPFGEFFNHENFKFNASVIVKRHCTIDAEELTFMQASQPLADSAEQEQPSKAFNVNITHSSIWFAIIAVAVIAVLIAANRSIAASRRRAEEQAAMRKKRQ
ncbi:MAG: hypothetical protein RMJ44_07895 [Cytophagales bacterium]|nr:hypothetical protein [Bernardetiaceae bacterium]MDW8210997.1 hypothetical protein [Cytophagales bacterium]